MTKSNFERMIDLAQEAFDAHNDPEQLDVNDEVIKKLQGLHPSTLSEYDDGNGPVVWILLIPTSSELMHQFIENRITETQLLDLTSPDEPFEAIYLCSAMVLPEFRGKGIAKKLALSAIEKIRETHPVKNLFVWAFSKEGLGLAKSIASSTALPLLSKQD
ncbi:MAG: GNAT family N-acetyltransferase [Bacteroidia bacterium]